MPPHVLQQARAALEAVRKLNSLEPIDVVSSQEDHAEAAVSAGGRGRDYLCPKPPFYDTAAATAASAEAVDTRRQSRLSKELKTKGQGKHDTPKGRGKAKAKAKAAAAKAAAAATAKAAASNASGHRTKAAAAKVSTAAAAAGASGARANQSKTADGAAPAYQANKFKDLFREFVSSYRQEHGCSHLEACKAWSASDVRAAIIGTLSASEISRRRLGARP